MAADTLPLAVLGGGGPDILAGRSLPSGEPGGGRCARAPEPADSPEPQPAQSAQPQQSPQSAQSSTGGAPGSDASGAVSSPSSSPNSPGKPRPASPDGSSGDSRPGKSATAAGTSPGSPQKATSRAVAGADDFPAALAQSLAAAPAGGAAPPDPTSGKAGADSGSAAGTSKPGAQPAKHPAADPLAALLALLEHALAGVLAGAPFTVPAASNASAAGAGNGSPQTPRSAAANSAPAALDSQLMQTLAADLKAAGSNSAPAAGTSAAAASAAVPAPTPGSAAAALTAAQLTAGPHVGSQQPAPPTAPMALSAPVGSSAWTDELGAKVTWMAHQGIESASLQLSPEHLGPLQVNISVHNGQASVWFGAAQPDTRTALQQSLPQLRQLFASQGLNLADAGVSRESPRGRGGQTPGRTAAPIAAVAAVALDGSPGRAAAARGLGLIDTYV